MSDTEGALLPKEDAKVSEEQTPETPTQDQNNATDPAMDLIDQTMAFLVRFASHEGFDRLRNLLQENGDLLLKLDKMEIAYHENLAQLGKTTLVLEDTKAQYDRELEAEKQAKEEALGGKASVEEDLEKRREELSQKAEEVVKHMEDIQDLRGQLEQRDETIRTLEGVQADRDELRTKLSETEQAIATKTSELEDANETVETLNSFMVDLRDPDDAKPHITKVLAEFFARSYKLFQRFVGRDLAPGYLARLSTMENPVSPKVPLPPSNTDDSKRMRIATGLLAYGKQLAISIWRPTYVTEDEGMNNVLDELNARDSQHEAQLRATILKALGVLEEHHEKVKRARVAKVEKRVFEALKFLVPDDKHVEFRNELQKLTSKISEIWEKLQSLETIVEPHFDVLGSGEWYALPEPDLLAGGELGKQKAPEKDEDVVIQVWPVFLYEDDETVLLHRAYTLTPQQVAGAEAEKAKNERARRAARQAERQNGVVRKRRDSGVGFLENGGSPGGTPPV